MRPLLRLSQFPVILAALAATTSLARADLLINGNFEAGDTGFSSDYRFASQSMTPGTFTVSSNPKNFNSTLESFGDHTSGTGMMEIVDGYSSSSRAWYEEISVIPDTSYTFSAWSRPTSPENLAQVELSASIGAASTPLTLTDGQWSELSLTFNSGSLSSVVVSIDDVNPQPLETGDDLAIDDVALQAGATLPEPASLSLMALAALPLLLRRRRG